MRKLVAIIMVVVLLLCLTSCTKTQQGDFSNDNTPNTTTLETTSSDEIICSESPSEPQEKPLSCDTLLTYARDWAKGKGLSFEFVSDIEVKPGKTADETITEFSFYGGFASASVSERNELVQTIMVVSLPSKIAEVYPSNTNVQNSQYALVICMELLKFCELDKDLDWHETQLKSAPDEGDDTMVIRSYTSNDWYYTNMIGEYFVTCVAARYCNTCKTNAPKVIFSSNTGVCDGCNYDDFHGGENEKLYCSQCGADCTYRGLEEDGRCEDCCFGDSNSPNDSGNSGGNASGGGNTSQPPAAHAPETQPNAPTTTVRICPQCGQSEPDVIFTEDWQPGDVCFGCNYDNFNVGEEGKKYCSQCGADCTYRGLEEDGRCEDCYFGDSNSPNDSGNSGGNTSQQPTSCSHNYTDATCTKPQTCTKCGAISGTALGHTYSNATCTTPQTCKICGATAGSAAGHKWKSATCTHPETCSVCNLTQGDALGHNMGLTKCSRCDYTDYSAIAKSYSKVTAYDSKTGEDLEVTNVSVSNAGILSFTFNGNTYSITIKERVYDSMTYFDCYQSGSKLPDAECRIGDSSYYNMLHFEWDGIDGHRLYFCTEKQ